mgnify:CR=1 FL=1
MGNAYPERAFDVRVNTIDGKMVLVRGMDAFELDEVSAFVWRSCDGSRGVPEIADLVTSEYDVGREQAMDDITTLVEDMRSAGLIE